MVNLNYIESKVIGHFVFPELVQLGRIYVSTLSPHIFIFNSEMQVRTQHKQSMQLGNKFEHKYVFL